MGPAPAAAAERNGANALARLGNTYIGPNRSSDSRNRDRWQYRSSNPLLAQPSGRLPNPGSQAVRSLRVPSVLEDVPVPDLINPAVSPRLRNENDLTVIVVRADLLGGVVDLGRRDAAPRLLPIDVCAATV